MINNKYVLCFITYEFINVYMYMYVGTFILGKEDHTIGNLLRYQLLRDPSVRFAGYRMPHPLVFDCHVRVETMDSKLTPINVRNV